MRLGGPVFETYDGPEQWVAAVKRLGYSAAYMPVDMSAGEDTIRAYADAAAKAGMGVPQDIRIVGFDGIPISAHSGIRLTTVELPYREMAREAVRLVLDEIEGQARSQPRTIILAPRLVVR